MSGDAYQPRRASASDVEDIRREMAEIRHKIHRDVAEVVEEAGSALNWRSYLQRAPWIAAAAAFGIGYLVVPRRSRVESRPAPAAAPLPRALPRKETPSGLNVSVRSIAGTLFTLVLPIAVRFGQSYAVGWLEDRLSRNTPEELQSRHAAVAQPTMGQQTNGPANRGRYS